MKKILLSLIIAGCLFACDDETLNPIVQPIAQTSEPMYITSTTATLVGNVLTGGGTEGFRLYSDYFAAGGDEGNPGHVCSRQ